MDIDRKLERGMRLFLATTDWTLLVAVLLSAALRCLQIESRELEYDEGATGYFAALPWSDLWSGPAWLEPNPPLFYSLAWIVQHCGGSIEQMRYVSALAGILCILAAFALAHRLAGGFAATAAAWLVATSAHDLIMSQYARAYSLLTFSLLCAFLCLVAASQWHPLLNGKTLSWAGTFALVAAIGCGALGPIRAPVLVFLVLLELRADVSAFGRPVEGWREMAMVLHAQAHPGDTIYLNNQGERRCCSAITDGLNRAWISKVTSKETKSPGSATFQGRS